MMSLPESSSLLHEAWPSPPSLHIFGLNISQPVIFYDSALCISSRHSHIIISPFVWVLVCCLFVISPTRM